MVQTRSRSSSKKNTTDTNMEVNRNVAEASNMNTMNQSKRKTRTAKNSIMKPIEASKKTAKKVVNAREPKGELTLRPATEEDLARDAFMTEYRNKYFEKHPGVTWLPYEEAMAGRKKFNQLVKKTKSKIVEEYLEKYTYDLMGFDVTRKYGLHAKPSQAPPFVRLSFLVSDGE